MCITFNFYSYVFVSSIFTLIGHKIFTTTVNRNRFSRQFGCITSVAPSFYQTAAQREAVNTTTKIKTNINNSNRTKSTTIIKTNFCVFNSIFTRNFTTTITNMSAKPCVTLDNINPSIKVMEYAVREENIKSIDMHLEKL